MVNDKAECFVEKGHVTCNRIVKEKIIPWKTFKENPIIKKVTCVHRTEKGKKIIKCVDGNDTVECKALRKQIQCTKEGTETKYTGSVLQIPEKFLKHKYKRKTL